MSEPNTTHARPHTSLDQSHSSRSHRPARTEEENDRTNVHAISTLVGRTRNVIGGLSDVFFPRHCPPRFPSFLVLARLHPTSFPGQGGQGG